ncbi:MAG: flagellar biosynthetic protein FliO [Planctomycetota bacterium]|nr:MAG: flagellar biosynthetic protein FliO [Planctomycetota bacterium]
MTRKVCNIKYLRLLPIVLPVLPLIAAGGLDAASTDSAVIDTSRNVSQRLDKSTKIEGTSSPSPFLTERLSNVPPEFRESEKKALKRDGQRSQINWQRANKAGPRQARQFGMWSLGDFIPLLAVLALIVSAAWVVKKFMPARRLFAGSGALNVVARTPLTAKQTLVLVKMGRKLLLLGISPDRVTTLSVVDDPDEVAMLLGQVASDRTDSMTRTFAESFAAEAEAYKREPVVKDPAAIAGGQVRGLLEKVRRLAGPRGVFKESM